MGDPVCSSAQTYSIYLPPEEPGPLARGDEASKKIDGAEQRSRIFSSAFSKSEAAIQTAASWGSPLIFSPLILLSLTGCSDGEPPKPDAGIPASPDSGPNCTPLQEGQTFFLDKDTTICPGTYRDARISITGQDGLTLHGEGVRLENTQDMGPVVGAIEFISSNNVTVTGFTVSAASLGILLQGSSGNRLEDLQVEVSGCNTVLQLSASAGNTARNVTLTGPALMLDVDRDPQNPSAGGRNRFSELTLTHVEGNCPTTPGITLESRGNFFQNNVLTGLPLALPAGSGGENIVEGNTLSGNLDNRFNTGLIVFSSSNQILRNRITQNRVGILLGSGAEGNTVTNNDLTGNTQACLQTQPGAANNLVQDNTCDRP